VALGEMSREGGAAVAAGGSESPGPYPEPSGNRTGRPLLRLPEGREVDDLPGHPCSQGGLGYLLCFPRCVISSHREELLSSAFGGGLHSLFLIPPGKL